MIAAAILGFCAGMIVKHESGSDSLMILTIVFVTVFANLFGPRR